MAGICFSCFFCFSLILLFQMFCFTALLVCVASIHRSADRGFTAFPDFPGFLLLALCWSVWSLGVYVFRIVSFFCFLFHPCIYYRASLSS
ncbi:uncharacterized protein B0T23DRAFT_376157 [Neurospora hispaniola]|uniref:Uncharacterized protein n=1 Tax=Neurospora hispaniola TaxID=588809 RepID=A0AAJ0MS20_9PEZI|nr:hypothetical protein B0T23DRAFT_376157 [Neurospora hispaniola]